METRIDEIADRVYRLSTWGQSGLTYLQRRDVPVVACHHPLGTAGFGQVP